MDHLKPLNIFLKQEVDRMQRVITTVRNTLRDLKLAIEGTIIMSENLKDALDNMFDARVPKFWAKVWNHILGLPNKMYSNLQHTTTNIHNAVYTQLNCPMLFCPA